MAADDFVSDPSDINPATVAAPDATTTAAVAEIDDVLDATKQKLKVIREQKAAERAVKRASLADVPERLLNQTQAALFLGVTREWFLRNREIAPKPLRLGSPTNPRAPLRWKLTSLQKWLDELQEQTDANRILSQPRERKSGV